MRVKTSRIFRLLASLFAALALAFGGAGVAGATSTSNSVPSNYCQVFWDGRGNFYYLCDYGNSGRFDNNGNRDFHRDFYRDNGNNFDRR